MAQSTVITLRISTDLQEQIKTMAQKEEIPASYIIRRLIKAGLHAEGKHMQSSIKTTAPTMPDWE
jgi:predicted transcriptional regulator